MIALDSALVLTRGNPVGPAAMLTQLHPSYGSFTAVARSSNSDSPLIGQINYRLGDRSARLCFLTPDSAADGSAVNGLVEGMAQVAGEWGALNVLAEIDEQNHALIDLRRSGFAVYAWQRIWELPLSSSDGKVADSPWQAVSSQDEVSARNLFHCLVPPLVQGAESFPLQRLQGFVYKQKGEVLAFVESVYGPRGIYLLPLIHPGVENVADLLAKLPQHVIPRLGRPIYMAVRSYQSWLESALEDMQATAAPRQALLVKHLAHLQRVFTLNARRTGIEKVKTEPTTSIVTHMSEPGK